jgi:threonine synthase
VSNKHDFNFRDAVYNGMASDGGLFLPRSIPHLLDEPVETGRIVVDRTRSAFPMGLLLPALMRLI